MQSEREELKKKYGGLFSFVSKVLFEEDPIGINFEDNTDEYDPEAVAIIPRLKEAHSAEETQTIVYEEFCRLFSVHDAGPKERYRGVSIKIWNAWNSSKAREPPI